MTVAALGATVAEATQFDPRAFRNALGCFPTGVAIMTTVYKGQPVGLTCSSFSSVSLEPPLVLWSLRRESKSLEAFCNSGAFAINILAEDQNLLSARFASGKIIDKFEGIACTEGLKGIPILQGCMASFECSTYAQHEAGDHVIFIGRVERFDHGRAEEPLVFYKGAYMMLTQSLSELAAKGRILPAELDEARMLVSGMLLRLACERGHDGDFDAIETLLREIDTLVAPGEMRVRGAKSVEFFKLLAKAAHNDVLAIVADSLSGMLQQAVRAQPPAGNRADLAQARYRILDSLRQRDADAALNGMQQYAAAVRPKQAGSS
ncbi:MAG: flavin reductase [Burkholderiaceae bacterium]|nr:flavin reductase [Burkholderiaceae bacterium]